ncbi:MAG: hypothetical protein ABI859_04320 [Pseudomonadota bacterium]
MKADSAYAAVAVCATVVAAGLYFGPAVVRPDIFDGDAAHHVFWLYRYVNADLYPGDITVDYLRTSAPVGYRVLYAAAAQVMDVAFATKLVAVALFLLSARLIWGIGAAIEGPDSSVRGLLALAGLLVVLAIAPEADLMPIMALQRTFALPITLLCLWALVARRYAWVGGSWVAAGLFYPVLLPTLGLAGGIVFLADMVRDRHMPARWFVNLLLASAALCLAIFGMPKAPQLGPIATYAQAITMPEFGPGGRLDLYGTPGPRNWVWNPIMGLSWPPKVLLAIGVATIITLVAGRRRLLPFAAWVMLAVGLGWWLTLRLFPEQTMFTLYVPNRHARWVVGTFGMLALASMGYVLVLAVAHVGAGRWRTRLPGALAMGGLLAGLLLLVPNFLQQVRTPPDQDLESIYAFIRMLPDSTLVAAHPDLANYIPVRTRHSVLASTETSMPWMLGYFAQVKPRVEAALRAAYVTDVKSMDEILAPYGIDVFVTAPSVWRKTGYLQPYDGMVQQLLGQGRARGFALQQPPQSRVLFRSGDYYVLRVERR